MIATDCPFCWTDYSTWISFYADDFNDVNQPTYTVTLGFDTDLFTYPLTVMTAYSLCAENVVIAVNSEVSYEYTIKSD